VRGKAFGTRAKFSVGGRIELLKSGEEVNKAIVRKMGMTRKRIWSSTPKHRRFDHLRMVEGGKGQVEVKTRLSPRHQGEAR